MTTTDSRIDLVQRFRIHLDRTYDALARERDNQDVAGHARALSRAAKAYADVWNFAQTAAVTLEPGEDANSFFIPAAAEIKAGTPLLLSAGGLDFFFKVVSASEVKGFQSFVALAITVTDEACFTSEERSRASAVTLTRKGAPRWLP